VKKYFSEMNVIDRRSFLKDIGYMWGTGLALTAFPWLSACAPSASKEVKGEKAKLAVIGTGSRGTFHINNLLKTPYAEIVALPITMTY
jgi:hypothetical protein